MTKEKLNKITGYLIDNVWRNGNVMYDNHCIEEGDVSNLVDIISSLHNLLLTIYHQRRKNNGSNINTIRSYRYDV